MRVTVSCLSRQSSSPFRILGILRHVIVFGGLFEPVEYLVRKLADGVNLAYQLLHRNYTKPRKRSWDYYQLCFVVPTGYVGSAPAR